jgi:hypothetical protein
MVITWSTKEETSTPFVEFGQQGSEKGWKQVNGSSTKFVDSGSLHSTQYIHRIILTRLVPNTLYSE